MTKPWVSSTIHVRIPPDMMEAIESIVSEMEYESVSHWVRAVLKREIKEHKEGLLDLNLVGPGKFGVID